MKKFRVILMVMAVLLTSSTVFSNEVVDWKALERKYGSSVIHEPSAGVWYGSYSDDAYRSMGAYAEYMAWFTGSGSMYDLGLGLYGMYSEGESQESTYTGEEWMAGVQAGIQRSWASEEDAFLRQLQLKLRLVYWQGKGQNQEGYWKDQQNILPGFYAEYLNQISNRTIIGLTMDGWVDIFSPLGYSSSWAGGTAEDRTQLNLRAIVQYQISRDWAVKAGVGPSYQGWDDLTLLGVFVEGRWRNTIMFGPSFSWASTGFSWTAFVRAELGWYLRESRKNAAMRSIQKIR